MNSRPAFKPELLLPAGGMESVVAAVQNGADAVYLGGRQFSARQNAENFDEEALEQAVRYCKARVLRSIKRLTPFFLTISLPRRNEPFVWRVVSE